MSQTIAPDRLYRLTPRQREVFQELAHGLDSKEAAEKLGVSKRTVDFHLDGIYKKLGVHNRLELLRVTGQLRGD